jgi:hypothetical protein
MRWFPIVQDRSPERIGRSHIPSRSWATSLAHAVFAVVLLATGWFAGAEPLVGLPLLLAAAAAWLWFVARYSS